MKITIISYDNWGLNKTLVDGLKCLGHEVVHIDFNEFKYQYTNFLYRIKNFFFKFFKKKNIKHIYYGKKINEQLVSLPYQDLIITIKADFIDQKYLENFKKCTKKSVAFFNDSASRCTNIKRVYTCFDKVFTFDRQDSINLNIPLLTNWIYTSKCDDIPIKYAIFNISSMDHRFTFLDKIAKVFYDLQLPYKLLILKNDKGFSSKYLTLINDKLTLTDIKNYSDESKILLDICRKKQVGLSFRIFESLGCHKKIITTNKDIINYDFYNPSNIFVIDEENVVIDTSFIESNYVDIPNHIYDKYTIKGWLDTINQE